jgi:simple sugar transport system substrate-binding protein
MLGIEVSKATLKVHPPEGPDASHAIQESREVWLAESRDFVSCPVYARDALKAGGAKVQVLAIPSEQAQNPQAVLQAIKGVLQATPTIDGIFTLGSAQSVNAIKATDELGITEKVFVGTVDISNLNLQLVQQKKMRFILDQQPYIQGFYSIVAAYQYARYRVFPIGQIVTSPFIITPDNVEEILAINKKYGGVRGAL